MIQAADVARDAAGKAAEELSGAADQLAARDWLAEGNRLLADLPGFIDRIDVYLAVALIPLGLVSLLYGYRIVKGMVVVYSSVGGAAAGWYLTTEVLGRPDLWWAGLLAGGIVLAALAWPLANVFIGVYGAVAGALAGYAVTQAIGDQQIMLIGVGAGLLLGAVLAALVFRFMVIVMTSILGAHMAVLGVVALLFRVEQVAPSLQATLDARHYLLPLVMAAPTLVGVVYQIRRTEGREAKEDRQAKE